MRLVFLTARRWPSTNGMMVRRSIDHRVDANPSRPAARRSARARTSAPGDNGHVGAVCRTADLPNGIMRSRRPDTRSCCRSALYRCTCSRNSTGSSHRIAVQQPGGVGGRRRIRDADARTVREDAFARLAVVQRALRSTPIAVRMTKGRRSGCPIDTGASTSRPASASSRARCSRKTDLDHRLEAAHAHADAAADDARGKRR
jgi:hypothetical protein